MQDKPKIALNLDTVERDGDRPEPFWVALGGKPYRLVDPQEIEWGILVNIGRAPHELLEVAVAKGDRDAFYEAVAKLPAWKINQLALSYAGHFGLPLPPEASALPTF